MLQDIADTAFTLQLHLFLLACPRRKRGAALKHAAPVLGSLPAQQLGCQQCGSAPSCFCPRTCLGFLRALQALWALLAGTGTVQDLRPMRGNVVAVATPNLRTTLNRATQDVPFRNCGLFDTVVAETTIFAQNALTFESRSPAPKILHGSSAVALHCAGLSQNPHLATSMAKAIYVRRRFLNIRTRKQPNRYIILAPQSIASGRPGSKTFGIESKQENIRIYIDLLYYLRGTLGMAALRLLKKCHRTFT